MSMIFIGDGFEAPQQLRTIDIACFRANEILGACKMSGIKQEDIDSDYDFPQKLDLRNHDQSDADSDSEETSSSDRIDLSALAEAEAEGVFGEPIFYESFTTRINLNQLVYFSNRPFILNENGGLDEMTDPGFIALHIQQIDMPDGYYPPPSTICSQYIFRQAIPDEGLKSVVYKCFSLEDSFRIGENDEELNVLIEKLHEIEDIIIGKMNDLSSELPYTHLARTPHDPYDGLSTSTRINGTN